MAEILEIRWHGRGGQGAKTAATFLAEAASSAGRFIQAFPEYGPERMGAPVASFNRISTEPIRIRSGVTDPEVVVVLDPTLMRTGNVTSGLKPDGIIIINSERDPADIREQLGIEGFQIFTVDANTISTEALGRRIPNTPMLGAVIRATGMLDYDAFMENMELELKKKFGGRPEIVNGNLEAIRRAYEEVQAE